MPSVPHPIPYQGSKRRLAPRILKHVPARVDRLIEPFAGSAALSLAAASHQRAASFLLGDSLPDLAALWQAILDHPEHLADDYARLWHAQHDDPHAFYDDVRATWNRQGGPARLLFLLARCVKNAVRFNADGAFNQSPDHRRRGTRPERMRQHLLGAHALLHGRTRAVAADYAELLAEARTTDLVYLDPPWEGTSTHRDPRYHQGLDRPRFLRDIESLLDRGVPFLISLDGRLGSRTYGQPLPDSLGLTRLELPAGRSSQATLHGSTARTIESLYLSPSLARHH